MKRTIVMAIALLAWALPAYAAADWSGYYVGAGLGSSFSSSNNNYKHTNSTCSNNNLGSDGGSCTGGSQNYKHHYDRTTVNAIGSINGGYNWQFDDLVVGIEPGLAIKDQSATYGEVLSSAFGDSVQVKTKQNMSASLRTNVGVPVDDFLYYGTIGLASTRFQTEVTQRFYGLPQNGRTIKQDEWSLGYILGGGVKYRLTENWLLGGELLYTDTGNSTVAAGEFFLPGGGGLKFPATRMRSSTASTTLQMGISYRF